MHYLSLCIDYIIHEFHFRIKDTHCKTCYTKGSLGLIRFINSVLVLPEKTPQILGLWYPLIPTRTTDKPPSLVPTTQCTLFPRFRDSAASVFSTNAQFWGSNSCPKLIRQWHNEGIRNIYTRYHVPRFAQCNTHQFYFRVFFHYPFKFKWSMTPKPLLFIKITSKE